MNTDQAQSTLITAGVVTVASTVIGGEFLQKPDLTPNVRKILLTSPVGAIGLDALRPRVVLGTLITWTALSVIAEILPDVAAGLSIAIAGTAFVTYGLPALESFLGTK